MTDEARMKKLESKSVYILREARAKYGRIGILWSGGKDSTVVIHLAREAFGSLDTVPIIFLDTEFAFPETIEYMTKLGSEWHFNWHPVINEDYWNSEDVVPSKDKFKCCTIRKTENLREALKLYGVDAIAVGIRRDEQAIRNKERFFSPRQTDGSWDYFNQPIEMQGWDLFVEDVFEGQHMRIHPLLEWNEDDIWEYIKKYNIPVNPLYFSKKGKRLRSIGCAPCTSFIESDASTIDEIIQEIREKGGDERQGRTQDKEADMNRLRALGYM